MSGSIASRRNYSTCRIYTSRLPPRPEPGRDWVAQELRQTCHADRRLLDVMLKVAAEAVRQVVEDDHPGLRIGMIYTCHTFGRDLGFKPHVHLVIPTQYSDPVHSHSHVQTASQSGVRTPRCDDWAFATGLLGLGDEGRP